MEEVIERGGRDIVIDLFVEEENADAIRLYQSLGFQPAEVSPFAPQRRRMVL
jgi:ribosomal protein S18 acetylase RimI-like enzyme